jgi:16S rRNA processing protein RimM
MRKEDCFYLGKIAKNLVLKGSSCLSSEPELYENLESVFVEYNKHLVPLLKLFPSQKMIFFRIL